MTTFIGSAAELPGDMPEHLKQAFVRGWTYDSRFFRRFPHRRHRMRLPYRDEAGAIAYIALGSASRTPRPSDPNDALFVIARRRSDGGHEVRLAVADKKTYVEDLGEDVLAAHLTQILGDIP